MHVSHHSCWEELPGAGEAQPGPVWAPPEWHLWRCGGQCRDRDVSLAHPCASVSVSAEGNLYAVGGYDSSSHLATVEKYEPQVNTGGLGGPSASPFFRVPGRP